MLATAFPSRLRLVFILFQADARQGLRVDGMSFRTVDQTRLIIDARDDCLVAVVVSWVREEGVVLVISRTPDSQNVLASAALLVRPIAAVQPIVVHQAFRMTGFALRDTPCALRVVSGAVGGIFFREDTELPGTTGRRDGTRGRLSLRTRDVPVVGAKLVHCSMFLVQQAVGTSLQRACSIHAQVVLFTIRIMVIMEDSFRRTTIRRY